MTATKQGGIKSAATNKKLYGEDFYVRVGRLGGSAPTTKPKGFAAMPREKVSAAGRNGGSRSRKS